MDQTPRIKATTPPRERVTRGQWWPPMVGDLVVRTLVDGEPCPPGWTEHPADPVKGSTRFAWRIWAGTETGIGDPDAAVVLRGQPGDPEPWA